MATDQSMDMDRTYIRKEQKKKFVLAGDPNRAMQQMMDTIDTLRDIYLKENEALYASDTRSFLNMQDEKIEAVRNYHDGAQQLLDRKSDLAHIDIAVKQQLAAKQEEFSGIMAENLKAIDRVRGSVTRLNDRIMSSARDAAQKKNVNYSKQGQLNKNERAVSIGVNESV